MSGAGRTYLRRSPRRSYAVRTPFVGAVGFIQFTLAVHKNALYNERVHGKEEHATSINTIPLQISHLFGFSVSNRKRVTLVFMLG